MATRVELVPGSDVPLTEKQEMAADLWEAVALIRDVEDGIAPIKRLATAWKLVWAVKERLQPSPF